VVVMLVGVDPLIAGRVAADLDAMHEVELLELVQGAVDARPADRVEPSVDPQRRHRAGLGGEQLDHLSPCRSTAVSSLIEALDRCLGPVHARDRIR